jgi:hypothetical protein
MDEMPYEPETATPVDTAEVAGDGSGGSGSLVGDLKSMGEKLAAALRAAAGTPEAESVKVDMREGLEALQNEIDRALQRVPKPDLQTGVQKGSDAASSATTKLRVGGRLGPQANKTLDRLANSMGGTDNDDRPGCWSVRAGGLIDSGNQRKMEAVDGRVGRFPSSRRRQAATARWTARRTIDRGRSICRWSRATAAGRRHFRVSGKRAGSAQPGFRPATVSAPGSRRCVSLQPAAPRPADERRGCDGRGSRTVPQPRPLPQADRVSPGADELREGTAASRARESSQGTVSAWRDSRSPEHGPAARGLGTGGPGCVRRGGDLPVVARADRLLAAGASREPTAVRDTLSATMTPWAAANLPRKPAAESPQARRVRSQASAPVPRCRTVAAGQRCRARMGMTVGEYSRPMSGSEACCASRRPAPARPGVLSRDPMSVARATGGVDAATRAAAPEGRGMRWRQGARHETRDGWSPSCHQDLLGPLPRRGLPPHVSDAAAH